MLRTGDWIESDSILQRVKGGKRKIWFKNPEDITLWVEMKVETVELK